MRKNYKEAKVNILKILKAKKISQYELAKRLNVPSDYVTRIIQRKNPTIKTLNKVGKAIGCKVCDMIEQ